MYVSLAPKVRADQAGLLYEGHDYPALGAAAELSMLMTYEWGYTYGPPMPVAPLPEVRRVADYAVREIPPEKLLLGIPNYGYDWPLPYVRGETAARSLGNEAAVRLAGERGAAVQYDAGAASPFYRYYDRSSGGEHIVWFENARSAEAKLRLIPEYSMAGFGVWNVMRPFPALWLLANSLFRIRKSA